MPKLHGASVLVCAAALAGCATTTPYYGARPYAPGTVYVERGENGEPVASAIDSEIAQLSTLPPVFGGSALTYRPPLYAYPFAPAPWYPYARPSSSLYFSWSSGPYWRPYRPWGAPPIYHRPLPVVPRAHVPPPHVHPGLLGGRHIPGGAFHVPRGAAPPTVRPVPPAVGRSAPGGGHRGFFGNPIGRKR